MSVRTKNAATGVAFYDVKAFNFPLVDDWRAHWFVRFNPLLGIGDERLMSADATTRLAAQKMRIALSHAQNVERRRIRPSQA